MADDAQASFKVSVVIPCYNEEAGIEATVTALAESLDDGGFDYELRLVDDGSRDRTWEVLQSLQQRFPAVRPLKNTGCGGYGMAVKAGLDTFEGDGVIVAMADGSESPGDVVAYAHALAEGNDCAFGTRFTGQTEVRGYPPVKRIFNRLGNWLIARLTGCTYDDYTNGFKGFRRPVIDSMQPLVSADFNLTVEMSIKAVQSGARFKVIPNHWQTREAGESGFNMLRLGPRYLWTIAYCIIGHYLRTAGARKR